jgi:hypothetical protein
MRRTSIALPSGWRKIYDLLGIAEGIFWPSEPLINRSARVVYGILIASKLNGLADDQS